MLYNKYRPKRLQEVIGNEEVISSVENMLRNNNVPHCVLFNGESGCGKTTIARILARELGCEGLDYKEVNAADFRGIDTVRELISSCKYLPLEGACKVFVIDECHKLTNDAQNALLKILEDTPKHVYFFLCTTDPQKLLTTVKSRAVQLQVKPLNNIQLSKLLKKVTKAEGDTISDNVVQQIIQDSSGRPREALTILEKVLNVPEEQRLEVAKQAATQINEAIELCRCLLNTNVGWKQTAKVLEGLKGQDAEGIRRVVLGYCQSILLKGNRNDLAALIIEQFEKPLYEIGFPGLVFNCYAIKTN